MYTKKYTGNKNKNKLHGFQSKNWGERETKKTYEEVVKKNLM